MGCTASLSSRDVQMRFSLRSRGTGVALLKLMRITGIPLSVVDSVFRHFVEINGRKALPSRTFVFKNDIWSYCSVQPGALLIAALNALGGDRNRLEFAELFIILYNFLTFSHERLVKFLFSHFDKDGSGFLEVDEIDDAIGQSYGQFVARADRGNYCSRNRTNILTAQVAMKNFDRNKSGRVSLIEFMRYCKFHPQLLSQAVTKQCILRKAFGTRAMWNREPDRQTKNAREG